MGLTTGLLTATAVALCPCVPALIPLAVEFVLVAFRLGLHIERCIRNIEHSPAPQDSSWLCAVSKMTRASSQADLDTFNQQLVSNVDSQKTRLADSLLDDPRLKESLHQCFLL